MLPVKLLCIMLLLKVMVSFSLRRSGSVKGVNLGLMVETGDTAVALLKAGAETDKKDVDGFLALELAPDAQVRKFILQSAEREGIEL